MTDEEKINLEKGEEEKDCPLSPTGWMMLLSDKINAKESFQIAFETMIITIVLAYSAIMVGSIYAFMNMNPELAPMVLPSLIKFWLYILCIIVVFAILEFFILKRTKEEVKLFEGIMEDIIEGEKDSNKIRELWKEINKVKSKYRILKMRKR